MCCHITVTNRKMFDLIFSALWCWTVLGKPHCKACPKYFTQICQLNFYGMTVEVIYEALCAI